MDTLPEATVPEGTVFEPDEEFLEFHKSILALYNSAEKLEEAMDLLQAFYDYSNPPSRVKNYDAYMDALQRTRVLLADWRGES